MVLDLNFVFVQLDLKARFGLEQLNRFGILWAQLDFSSL